MIRKTVLPAALLLILAAVAAAADNTGVKIYPRAQYDEQWSKLQAELAKASGGVASACYRTKDPVKKVVEFYQREGFKVGFGAVTDDGARMQKGDALSLTIKKMKLQDNTDYSRLCIVKTK